MQSTDWRWEMLVCVARPSQPSSLLTGLLGPEPLMENGWLGKRVLMYTGYALFLKTDADGTQACPCVHILAFHKFNIVLLISLNGTWVVCGQLIRLCCSLVANQELPVVILKDSP